MRKLLVLSILLLSTTAYGVSISPVSIGMDGITFGAKLGIRHVVIQVPDTIPDPDPPVISNVVVNGGTKASIACSFNTNITAECWFEVQNHSEYIAPHHTGISYSGSVTDVANGTYYIRCVAVANDDTVYTGYNYEAVVSPPF